MDREMVASRFLHRALGAAAAMMLAGCGGSPPPSGAPGAMPQTSALAAHADRGRSWILPEAKRIKALIYASDSNSSNAVDVYDYNNRKQVGRLTGFDRPFGECIDARGDVYITNSDSDTTVEYAHAGSSPLKTFTTTNG
jgi:hypothetical protein